MNGGSVESPTDERVRIEWDARRVARWLLSLGFASAAKIAEDTGVDGDLLVNHIAKLKDDARTKMLAELGLTEPNDITRLLALINN